MVSLDLSFLAPCSRLTFFCACVSFITSRSFSSIKVRKIFQIVRVPNFLTQMKRIHKPLLAFMICKLTKKICVLLSFIDVEPHFHLNSDKILRTQQMRFRIRIKGHRPSSWKRTLPQCGSRSRHRQVGNLMNANA